MVINAHQNTIENAEEFALGCDSDESWARGEGDFEFAVFSQNLARGLRSSQLLVTEFLTNYSRTDVIGGCSHLRVKAGLRRA